MGCCAWHSPALEKFSMGLWIDYLYSFRQRPSSLAQPPSQLSILFVGHDSLMSTSAPPNLG